MKFKLCIVTVRNSGSQVLETRDMAFHKPLGTEFLASPLGTVAMPLSQMFDKVFGMIKSDMYVIKLQEKEEELSVLERL